jgi:hypothetical protein
MKLTATLVCLYIGLFITISGNATPFYLISKTAHPGETFNVRMNAGMLSGQALRIYPASPAILNIERKSAATEAQLRIIDQSGKAILSLTMPVGTLQYGLQLNNLMSGAYTIQLIEKNSTEIKKFMML